MMVEISLENNFRITRKNIKGAYQAIMALSLLPVSDIVKSAISSMDERSSIKSQVFTFFEQIGIEAVDWNSSSFSASEETDCWFSDSRITGVTDDDYIWNILAPYVKAGSYIYYQGDTDGIWKYKFDGKNCELVECIAEVREK